VECSPIFGHHEEVRKTALKNLPVVRAPRHSTLDGLFGRVLV